MQYIKLHYSISHYVTILSKLPPEQMSTHRSMPLTSIGTCHWSPRWLPRCPFWHAVFCPWHPNVVEQRLWSLFWGGARFGCFPSRGASQKRGVNDFLLFDSFGLFHRDTKICAVQKLLYVWLYVYIHIYIYIYTHIHIYIYRERYRCTFMYTCHLLGPRHVAGFRTGVGTDACHFTEVPRIPYILRCLVEVRAVCHTHAIHVATFPSHESWQFPHFPSHALKQKNSFRC